MCHGGRRRRAIAPPPPPAPPRPFERGEEREFTSKSRRRLFLVVMCFFRDIDEGDDVLVIQSGRVKVFS